MLCSRILRQSGRQLHRKNGLTCPSASLSPRTRAFHATTPRNNIIFDTALYLPHELLQFLHGYVPWYAAIPMSAFIMRGVLVTTLGSRVRSNVSRYMMLNPLRTAISLSVTERMANSGELGDLKSPQARNALVRARRKEVNALNERWKCTMRGQIGWTFAQLPIFLAFAETLRRMSGYGRGLLRIATDACGITTPLEAGKQGIGVAYGTDIAANPWFDGSLATEGALWFPDLLIPDPTGALPFIVSGLMFTNVYTSTLDQELDAQRSRFSKVLRTTALGLSASLCVLLQYVPASMVLYWASSSASALVWNCWLSWRYPIARGFQPCKRPLLKIPPPQGASSSGLNMKVKKARF
ncbi:uncharacterized protein EI97DRAFT_198938 [Westerdykella ornata]|uniref:Mitochondrial export translocase Oxa2 n=1 Tax=Westerdykella ornata TaxID=318751 RepID=A0A6A6J832_WESOR|nr:uncharacterized protein EI97DRAFT_198938 [Westerdykella ornata]KAF2272721.1 hypothetical protein EI97DRAFT_198938 [Westerdykella ornata]